MLVWAGRAHVAKVQVTSWQPMAYEFQKMTGIDPLCFCTTTYFEREKPNLEMAEYKMATNQGLIDIPRVFINDKGETYGTWGYIDIFFPRQKFDHGRAD